MAEANLNPSTQVRFFSANSQGHHLFSVCEDVPIEDMLQNASCFLSVAKQLYYDDSNGELSSGAAYMVEMAKALVESAICQVVSQRRKEVAA